LLFPLLAVGLLALFVLQYSGAVPAILPFLTEKLSPDVYRRSLTALIEISKPVAVVTYRAFAPEVEKALNVIARKHIRVVGAGRTDTGVHATGQVIAFHLNWRHSIADLHRALNANLPPDIVLKALTEAEANFHPRFDALNRQYRYTVLNQPV
jgi:hypothetical protein